MAFSSELRKQRILRSVLVVGLSIASGGPSLLGQSASSGTVSGQVSDQLGAVVTGAAVSLIDATTNAARSTTSNETGRYDFVNHPARAV